MIPFRSRLILGVGLTGSIAILYWTFDQSLVNSLRPAAMISGWVLFGLIGILALFNARKKLPFLPLLKASTWMQFHIYAGLFAVFLFALHCSFRAPRGNLETVLALVFCVVTVSGLVGLAISRWVPSRLTLHGENVIFERIPALRNTIKQEVEALVLASAQQTRSTTIIDFYEQRLRAYFERPRHLWLHLLGYSKPLHALLSEVAALDRYLNVDERKLMAEISQFIRSKENLDFQLTAQRALKLWLFVHIPMTYALILLALVHGIIAWAFT
jgi:hypothetical protein